MEVIIPLYAVQDSQILDVSNEMMCEEILQKVLEVVLTLILKPGSMLFAQ